MEEIDESSPRSEHLANHLRYSLQTQAEANTFEWTGILVEIVFCSCRIPRMPMRVGFPGGVCTPTEPFSSGFGLE